MVVNELVEKLDENGSRVIAYADDVPLMFEGKFRNTTYELTQGYLSIVSNWAAENDLSINPSKTELVLFNRKYKIPEAHVPLMEGTRLGPAELST